jgi:hypothetical protein
MMVNTSHGFFSSFFALAAVVFAATVSHAQVRIQSDDAQIAVSINGKRFTALHKGKEANKPYLWPLLTASGRPVTRAFPMEQAAGDPTDHPHQRGMWIGYEHVSGSNIWEIDPADPQPHSGSIQFQNVIETHDGDKTGGFTVSAQWLNQDGKPVIDETLTLTFYAEPAESRMFDVYLRLKAIKLSTFEDARDGLIGFRFTPAFDETRGGKVVNAEGIEGADNIEGTHSNWVDWQAEVDGEKVGVAVLNHPSNHRAPTTWRLKPFGLVFANPFAQRYYDKTRPDGAMSLQPGDELRLRYRVLIHSTNTSIAAAYKEFSGQ